MNFTLEVIMAFFGSLGFAMLFEIKGKKLFFASLGGMIGWIVYLCFAKFSDNLFLGYFVATCVVAAYGEIMARVSKSAVTGYLVAGVVPMIPGGSLYYTMSYAVSNNRDMFFFKAEQTFIMASAIAAGLVFVLALVNMQKAFKRSFNLNK